MSTPTNDPAGKPDADEADPLEPRLARIESKLALAEDAIDAQNREIYRQQKEIERLKAQLRYLYGEMNKGGGAQRGDLREEIPPHW